MSDPRNQARAEHQQLEGKSLSHLLFGMEELHPGLFHRQIVTGQETMALN